MYSTKGLSKRQNVIDKDVFLAVLTNRRSGGGGQPRFPGAGLVRDDVRPG